MAKINIPKTDKATRIAIQKLSKRLRPDRIGMFANVTLTDLTTNSLIYPDGDKSLTSLGAATNGQLPIGSTGATPVLATITGVANETDVTVGAGTITIGLINPLIVAKGGTGRATSTTAYGLVAAGTTATGVHQTLAAGLTTQILVGSGAAALPAWGADLPTAVTIGSAYVYRAGGTDIPVTDGGTGTGSLIDHGILLGSGTNAITPLGVAANGKIPIGSAGADPVLAEITGTANQITSTPGAGSITLSTPQDIHSGAGPTFGTLTLSNIANEATDVDKFLVDSSGLIKYRTGAEVLSDIGALSASHQHDTETLEHDAVNSDGGAFSFTTSGTVTFNQSLASANYIAVNLLTACATNAGELDFTAVSKKLDVENNTIVSQDYSSDASPTFANLSLGTGELTCGSINRASGTLTLEIGGTAEQSITATATTFGGNLIIPDGGTIGQAAGPLLTFDDTNNYLEINGANIIIGGAIPDCTLHIQQADVSAAAHGDAVLCVEGDGHTLIQILSTATKAGTLAFGDPGNSLDGYIQYLHGDGTGGTRRLKIAAAGVVQIACEGGKVALGGENFTNSSLTVPGALSMLMIGAAPVDTAGYAQLWVTSTAPQYLRWTEGGGTDYYICMSDTSTGGTGSAGAGNQYVEIEIAGNTYKVLHDGTV